MTVKLCEDLGQGVWVDIYKDLDSHLHFVLVLLLLSKEPFSPGQLGLLEDDSCKTQQNVLVGLELNVLDKVVHQDDSEESLFNLRLLVFGDNEEAVNDRM